MSFQRTQMIASTISAQGKKSSKSLLRKSSMPYTIHHKAEIA